MHSPPVPYSTTRTFVVLLLLLTAGCGPTLIQTTRPELAQRAVFLDSDGEAIPVQPRNDPAATWAEEYDLQLGRMMNAIRSANKPKGIMIVVHGGLTALTNSARYAELAGDSIDRAGYYPVLLNWRSDGLDSYAEHTTLFQGRVVRPIWVPGLVVINPVADVGRGFTRPFHSWAATIEDRFRSSGSTTGEAEYEALRAQFADTTQLRVSMGDYVRPSYNLPRAVYRGLMVPVGIAFAPISDAFGTPAWDNMNRRTKNLFRQPAEFATTDAAEGLHYLPGSGGASILMDSIVRMLDEHPMEITLIGHSMGAIVLNELIRLYPDVSFKNIVYMAAANSIRDFHESVVPYLERHPESRFYNLTLHPISDANEFNWLGLAPRGSLLEYIDDYYSKPATEMDRTLGKWVNIMEATHLFPESIRGRVTLKAFGVNDACRPVYGSARSTPTAHGEFNDVKFAYWREEFWQAVPPESAPCEATTR